jgi:hypothetical protein
MRTIVVLTALLAAAPAFAADRAPPKAGQVDEVIACAKIADGAARLACYDRSVQSLSGALSRKDLVVVDREKARATSRSLFGFSVPKLAGLFGGSNALVDHIDSTITGARPNINGGWTITLADGSTWDQIDDTALVRDPRRGAKVQVREGFMGSFILTIDGELGFKAKRVG